jgi:hypothetical protein
VGEARYCEIGSQVPPEDREEYDRALAAMRAAVGEGAWQRLFAEGAGWSPEEASENALGEGEESDSPGSEHRPASS